MRHWVILFHDDAAHTAANEQRDIVTGTCGTASIVRIGVNTGKVPVMGQVLMIYERREEGSGEGECASN